jgi:DNA-binding transcriptional regulator YbjK
LSKTFEQRSSTVPDMAVEPSPPDAPPRGRRDLRGERRRAELLDAAIHLIGAHGIDGVTHRAVAAAAGVPAASTSYYFRSKDELIHEALRTLAEREIERLRARREALGDGVADLEQTTAALAAWIEEQMGPEGRAAMLAQYQLQLEAARRPEAREILEAWKNGTDELSETAMRSLGANDVRTAGILLVCAIDGLRLRLLASGHEPLVGDELRAVLRALLTGLIAADGRPPGDSKA